jgi:hypothetical protein
MSWWIQRTDSFSSDNQLTNVIFYENLGLVSRPFPSNRRLGTPLTPIPAVFFCSNLHGSGVDCQNLCIGPVLIDQWDDSIQWKTLFGRENGLNILHTQVVFAHILQVRHATYLIFLDLYVPLPQTATAKSVAGMPVFEECGNCLWIKYNGIHWLAVRKKNKEDA